MVNWKPVAAQFGQHFLHNLGNQIATRYGANPQELYERRGVPQQAPDYMQLLGGAYSKYSPYVRNSGSSLANNVTQRRNNYNARSPMTPTQQGIEPMEMQKEEGYYNRPGNGYSSAAMPMVPATMMPVPPNSPRASYSRSTKFPMTPSFEESGEAYPSNYFQNQYGLNKSLPAFENVLYNPSRTPNAVPLQGEALSKRRNLGYSYNQQGVEPMELDKEEGYSRYGSGALPLAQPPSPYSYTKLFQSKPIMDSYEFQNKTFGVPVPPQGGLLYNPWENAYIESATPLKGQQISKKRNFAPINRSNNTQYSSFLERLWRQFINNQGS